MNVDRMTIATAQIPGTRITAYQVIESTNDSATPKLIRFTSLDREECERFITRQRVTAKR